MDSRVFQSIFKFLFFVEIFAKIVIFLHPIFDIIFNKFIPLLDVVFFRITFRMDQIDYSLPSSAVIYLMRKFSEFFDIIIYHKLFLKALFEKKLDKTEFPRMTLPDDHYIEISDFISDIITRNIKSIIESCIFKYIFETGVAFVVTSRQLLHRIQLFLEGHFRLNSIHKS